MDLKDAEVSESSPAVYLDILWLQKIVVILFKNPF